MLGEMDDRLLELRRKVQAEEKLRPMLEEAQLELERERTLLVELQAEMVEEAEDVQKLEGLSLTSLLHTILGGKDQQIAEEKQEYLAARLKCEECADSVAALQKEVAELGQRLSGLGDVRAQYETLLAEKERGVAEQGGLGTGRIFELTGELAKTHTYMAQVQEALDAGTEALMGLKQIAEPLDSARNWGTWDMLGGGLLATAAKHSRIDDATAKVQEVQHLLRRFQREVTGVTGQFPTGFTVEVEQVPRFADLFFDGLLFDWMAQSKINRSRGRVRDVTQKVEGAVAILREKLDQLHLEAQNLEAQRREAIERA
jgi:hypothetical protein